MGGRPFFTERGEKPFRAKQVYKWIHQRGVAEFDAMTDIAKALPFESVPATLIARDPSNILSTIVLGVEDAERASAAAGV